MSEKTKGAWLAGLLAVAAIIWYFESRSRSIAPNTALVADPLSYRPLAVENPELQRAKLEASRKTEYKSNGRDLFSEVALPPPDTSAKTNQPPVQTGPVIPPPPPPPALPVNMRFFGYGTVPNGSARRAFLSDGDEVYIVAEGDTLLGKYRIVKVGNANLDFEEIATGRRGSTTLSEDQGTTPAS
jgi:hypothetical protein